MEGAIGIMKFHRLFARHLTLAVVRSDRDREGESAGSELFKFYHVWRSASVFGGNEVTAVDLVITSLSISRMAGKSLSIAGRISMEFIGCPLSIH